MSRSSCFSLWETSLCQQIHEMDLYARASSAIQAHRSVLLYGLSSCFSSFPVRWRLIKLGKEGAQMPLPPLVHYPALLLRPIAGYCMPPSPPSLPGLTKFRHTLNAAI